MSEAGISTITEHFSTITQLRALWLRPLISSIAPLLGDAVYSYITSTLDLSRAAIKELHIKKGCISSSYCAGVFHLSPNMDQFRINFRSILNYISPSFCQQIKALLSIILNFSPVFLFNSLYHGISNGFNNCDGLEPV
jgi:hypothetical protein